MQTNTFSVSRVGVFLVVALTACWSKTAVFAQEMPPSYYLWMSEQWTGDSAPYKKVQQEVDYAFARRQIDVTKLEIYKKWTVENSSNPLNVFRWGYAATRYAAVAPSARETSDAVNAVDYYFAQAPSPRVYEYDRIRFLIHARRGYTFGRKLGYVGQRLLTRRKDDYSVKFWLVKVLAVSVNSSDQAIALRLSQELVKSHPQKASVHSLLAEQYYDRWLGASQKKQSGKYFADKAIASYQQYLKLASPNPRTQRNINARIKRMRTG